MNQLKENKKLSEVLADKILQLSYGEVILHQDIEEIIGEKYGTDLYNSTVQRAKKILLKNSRAIESVRGQGYRVVEPDSFVDLSLDHYRRGFNEFQKGTDTLTYAPKQDMSVDGRQRYQRVYDRMNILQASMNETSVELKTLAKKEHPLAVNLS